MKQVVFSAVDAFNMDRGGVYTIKQLCKNPGETIRDYLGANRYHYTPPFRILIITTAIALFLIGLAEFTQHASADFSKGYASSVEEKGGNSQDAVAAVIKVLRDIQGYLQSHPLDFYSFHGCFYLAYKPKKKIQLR